MTIVTVVRNGRGELPRTVESVRRQAYEPLEHLIVDGGSTDGTIDWLAGQELIGPWISERDRGIYDAMNKGLALAQGELVGLLNAGDRYWPGALAAAARAYLEHGDDCIYYGDHVVDYHDLGIEVRIPAEPSKFRYKMAVCHESVFFPRALFEKIGLHNLDYTLAADFELLAGEYFRGRQFVDIGQPIAVFETGGASTLGFVRYRHECLAAHRRLQSGYWGLAALAASAEVALYAAHRMVRPLLGRRLADGLRRRWFRGRAARAAAKRMARSVG